MGEEEVVLPKPLKPEEKMGLKFDETVVYRRAALGLLPGVQDPEYKYPMQLSLLKSCKKVQIAKNRTNVTAEGPYVTARTTRGFKVPGKYYWEATFSKTEENSHVRIGIATVRAEMEAPVGYDESGYSIRDLGGAFHDGEGHFFDAFEPGKVIGFGFTVGEIGKLEVWIDGVYKGVVFDGIDTSKRWFPTFSVYKGAIIDTKFQEPFQHFPGSDWKAASTVPQEEPRGDLTAKFVVNFMKNGSVKDLSDALLTAIDYALVPPNIMPD